MTGLINPDQLLHGNMGVFLSRRQAFMPQKLLDRAQIGPCIQHVGRKSMAEGMGMHFQLFGKPSDMPVDDIPNTSGRQSPAPDIKKDSRPFDLAFAGLRRSFCPDEISPDSQVVLQGFARPFAERNDAFLGPVLCRLLSCTSTSTRSVH